MMKQTKKWRSRVDVQVSVLIAVVVFASTISISYLCYYITYGDMIRSLADRAYSIYDYVEKNLDKETFYTIDDREDFESPAYKVNKTMLEQIKYVCNVRYLYTAKMDDKGDLIYILDGLDYEADDFRYPGDLIEPEIQDVLHRALSGEVIMPNEIQDTGWGKIFITYLPIHDGDKIIGVLGLEFEAVDHFNTYAQLKGWTPIISFILCLVSVLFATYAFRRISNPLYKDLYNTDQITGLKSRNAFEVDMKNINAKKKYHNMGVIVMDLNALKTVNDKLGHAVGDQYIGFAAEAFKKFNQENMVFFRIGGDEFVVFIDGAKDAAVTCFISQVQAYIKDKSKELGLPLGISSGYAVYEKDIDDNFLSTYKRADEAMYIDKKRSH